MSTLFSILLTTFQLYSWNFNSPLDFIHKTSTLFSECPRKSQHFNFNLKSSILFMKFQIYSWNGKKNFFLNIFFSPLVALILFCNNKIIIGKKKQKKPGPCGAWALFFSRMAAMHFQKYCFEIFHFQMMFFFFKLAIDSELCSYHFVVRLQVPGLEHGHQLGYWSHAGDTGGAQTQRRLTNSQALSAAVDAPRHQRASRNVLRLEALQRCCSPGRSLRHSGIMLWNDDGDREHLEVEVASQKSRLSRLHSLVAFWVFLFFWRRRSIHPTCWINWCQPSGRWLQQLTLGCWPSESPSRPRRPPADQRKLLPGPPAGGFSDPHSRAALPGRRKSPPRPPNFETSHFEMTQRFWMIEKRR